MTENEDKQIKTKQTKTKTTTTPLKKQQKTQHNTEN